MLNIRIANNNLYICIIISTFAYLTMARLFNFTITQYMDWSMLQLAFTSILVSHPCLIHVLGCGKTLKSFLCCCPARETFDRHWEKIYHRPQASITYDHRDNDLNMALALSVTKHVKIQTRFGSWVPFCFLSSLLIKFVTKK